MAIYPLNQSRASLVVLGALVGLGNPLACLLALAFLGPLPVTTETIATATKQDPRTAKRGLRCLEQMGFALNVPYAQSDGWLISAQAFQSPLLLDLMLTAQNAVSSSPAAAEIAELTTKNAVSPLLTTKNVVSPPQSQSQLININDSISSDPENELAELRAQYLKVLAAGPVFPNIRKGLAETLAAEGPAYLPHLLAHLARCKSGRYTAEGYDKPGVYLKDQAQVRGEVEPGDLPPDGLTFADALAWAMNGGKTPNQLAEEESARVLTLAQQEIANTETERLMAIAQAKRESAQLALVVEAHPSIHEPIWPGASFTYATLWQAALDQLQLEIPRATFETWLRDAAIVSVDNDTLTLTVKTNQQRDWLTHRLLSTLKRSVSGLAGRSLAIRITAQGL